MIFTHDICFIASEAIELKDRAQLEHFIDSYTAQPTAFSSGWDHRRECVAGDVGWVVAFGHDTAEAGAGRPAVSVPDDVGLSAGRARMADRPALRVDSLRLTPTAPLVPHPRNAVVALLPTLGGWGQRCPVGIPGRPTRPEWPGDPCSA
jgi:hypothetical protein